MCSSGCRMIVLGGTDVHSVWSVDCSREAMRRTVVCYLAEFSPRTALPWLRANLADNVAGSCRHGRALKILGIDAGAAVGFAERTCELESFSFNRLMGVVRLSRWRGYCSEERAVV